MSPEPDPTPPTSATRPSKLTPMMAQYHDIKSQHPDALLLFRMGDFYETFYEDAATTSRVLGIALTTRDRQSDAPVPLAGVPHHSVEGYVARLLRAGYKVAICEQLEDPALAKGLVRRDVTEVLTPGTALTPALLPERDVHYALCLALEPEHDPSGSTGFSFLDFSTGEFGLGECCTRDALDLVARYAPGELFLPQRCLGSEVETVIGRRFESLPRAHIEDALFNARLANETLRRHFGVDSLAGLDCADLPQGVRAAGALLEHGGRLKKARLDAVTRLQVVRSSEEMFLDEDTLSNLEIFRPLRGQDPAVTLVHHLDACCTTMGSRMLRRWLRAPLRRRAQVEERHEAQSWWLDRLETLNALRTDLARVGDLERLMGRIAADRATPRDLQALAQSAEQLPTIRAHLAAAEPAFLARLHAAIDLLADVVRDIRRTLVDEPPGHVREGGVIRPGVSDELDALLGSTRAAREWIASLQESERRATGIAKLKVGYNKVFGYYLEVPRGQVDKVPEHYSAKQTLVAAQRYITPELKEKEQLVLRAETERVRLETQLFAALRQRVSQHAERVASTAAALASIDALASFAWVAHKRDFVRPRMTDGDSITIRAGRHPVVEALLQEDFVPNDVATSTSLGQILLITGPNMGGKSTFLRQVALAVLMAYSGCFVPAAEAEIGRVDRIFTRVGASDNLARGQSTFLVEMIETAKILNACSDESLVILDEVGRGTSTHDGMSLAWAVLEYLHDRGPARPHTLFATHYHELTVLEETLSRLRNLTVTVKEWQDEIVFLHRVEPGRADKSYGIQVAKLAGLPDTVIERAREILQAHEKMEHGLGQLPVEKPAPGAQLELFASQERLVAQRVRQAEPEKMTEAEAHALLRELRRQL
ncbi:MAG: DNA mismatch repair protein MutS [Candidatus Latescibacterota bacterium]|nr:MAG: DNA mismatch repair protein MutS [Candidatus Latescibacterota bacterium]